MSRRFQESVIAVCSLGGFRRSSSLVIPGYINRYILSKEICINYIDTIQGSVDTRQGSVETRQGSVDIRQGSVDTKQGSVDTRQERVDTRQGS